MANRASRSASASPEDVSGGEEVAPTNLSAGEPQLVVSHQSPSDAETVAAERRATQDRTVALDSPRNPGVRTACPACRALVGCMRDIGGVAPNPVPRAEAEAVLALDVPARLATFDSDGFPWITPLWFVWDGDAFYMTSVRGKRQLRNLRNDNRAAIIVDVEQAEAIHGVRRNRQVKGKGRAQVAPDLGGEWTRLITLKYMSGDEGVALAERRAAMDRVVIRLQPRRLLAVGTPGAPPLVLSSPE